MAGLQQRAAGKLQAASQPTNEAEQRYLNSGQLDDFQPKDIGVAGSSYRITPPILIPCPSLKRGVLLFQLFREPETSTTHQISVFTFRC